MEDSILLTIKKLLGIEPEYEYYDNEIIPAINTVLYSLRQVGLPGYSISDATQTWYDYLGARLTDLEAIKTFIYLKTRLIFDPPTNSTHIDSINKIASELEYRLYMDTQPEYNN